MHRTRTVMWKIIRFGIIIPFQANAVVNRLLWELWTRNAELFYSQLCQAITIQSRPILAGPTDPSSCVSFFGFLLWTPLFLISTYSFFIYFSNETLFGVRINHTTCTITSISANSFSELTFRSLLPESVIY